MLALSCTAQYGSHLWLLSLIHQSKNPVSLLNWSCFKCSKATGYRFRQPARMENKSMVTKKFYWMCWKSDIYVFFLVPFKPAFSHSVIGTMISYTLLFFFATKSHLLFFFFFERVSLAEQLVSQAGLEVESLLPQPPLSVGITDITMHNPVILLLVCLFFFSQGLTM
jgi:hypothetical protein